MNNRLFLIGLPLFVYLIFRSKSDATSTSILATDGYVPPQADPVTTTPVKVNPAQSTPATGSASTSTASPVVLSKNRCRANQKVNIRDYFNPDKVVRQAYVGEIIGTYLTQKELTIKGVTGKNTYVNIKAGDLLPGVNNYYYVLKSAIDFIV